MQLYTRLNRSGRSHAAVKAPIPPLLHPAMARSFPFLEIRIGRPSEAFFKFDVGQQFGFDEPDEIVVDGVELEAAVITHGKTGAIDYSPGTDENADRHRNLFFCESGYRIRPAH